MPTIGLVVKDYSNVLLLIKGFGSEEHNLHRCCCLPAAFQDAPEALLPYPLVRKPGSPFLDSGFAEITHFLIEVSVDLGPRVHRLAGSPTATLETGRFFLYGRVG